MNKVKTIIFIIFVLSALWGLCCGGMSANIPKDFEMEYLWGGGYQFGGAKILRMKANGEANLLIVGDEGSREEKKFSFSGEELSTIYKTIRENKFFGLKRKYRNFEILDGGYSYIVVTAGGKEHKVLVSNTSVQAYGNITKVILELLRAREIID